MKSALLVLDMQSGILGKNIYERRNLIDNVNMAIIAFEEKSLPVFLSRHTNTSSLKPQTVAWELSPNVCQPAQAIVINKHRSNILMENSFTELLQRHNIKRIYVCGIVSNGCVQAACVSAHECGFDTVLLSDAHSTLVKDAAIVISEWNSRLKDMGINVISTHEAVGQFK